MASDISAPAIAGAEPAPPPVAAEGEAYPSATKAWSAVIMLLLLYILSQLDRNLLSLLSEPIKHDLSLTDVQMGWLYGPAFAVFFALGALPVGWALDRYDRRFVLALGVIVWSVATAACGARSFVGLLLARMGVGVGQSVMPPGSQSILPDMFPPSRLTLPFSIYSLGAKGGAGISFILGGALIAMITPSAMFHIPLLGDLKGWQLIFVAVGLPGVLISLLAFAIPDPPRRNVAPGAAQIPTTFADYFAFISRNRRFMLCMIAGTVCTMIVSTGMTTWTPAFFARVHGWKLPQVAFWLGLAIVIGPLVGLPIHGALTDWLYRRGLRDAHMRYLTVTMLVTTPLAVASYLVPNAWASLALVGLTLAVMAAYLSVLPAGAQLIVPGNLRGKSAAVVMFVASICGMAAGPAVVAFLTDHVLGDPRLIGWSLALCSAIGLPITALLFFFAQKPMRETLAARERT